MPEFSEEDRRLRDLYACQAIACFTLNDEGVVALLNPKEGVPRHDIVAKFCFDLADTMMMERAKRQ